MRRIRSRQARDGARIRFRHAVGRAVATSSGPRLDVSREAGEAVSAAQLLGVEQPVVGRPALVILQAEPTAEAVDADLSDDGPERLALARDLIEAGVPAVLMLPALQAELADAVDAVIASRLAALARGRLRPRRLRAEIRGAIPRHVEPRVLDDIVLFLNPRSDQ